MLYFQIQTKKQICKHRPPVTSWKGSNYKAGRGMGWVGSTLNHSNCLHVLGPTFLVSATLKDFLMSRFVTPSVRVNGGESNVAKERRGGGGRGVGVGVSAAGRAWPVGSSDAERRHHPTGIRPSPPFSGGMWAGEGCAGPSASLNPVRARGEHHPGRGVSTGARSTACCLSTACGAATGQVPFPLPTCTCGLLGIVHFFFPSPFNHHNYFSPEPHTHTTIQIIQKTF